MCGNGRWLRLQYRLLIFKGTGSDNPSNNPATIGSIDPRVEYSLSPVHVLYT